MSTRDVFSGQELARLRGFPEISREELIRFFTLSAADEAFVLERAYRLNRDRLDADDPDMLDCGWSDYLA